jgi:hypothetical protein
VVEQTTNCLYAGIPCFHQTPLLGNQEGFQDYRLFRLSISKFDVPACSASALIWPAENIDAKIIILDRLYE